MTIIYVLWFAMAGVQPAILGEFPGPLSCLNAAMSIKTAWSAPPRAFLFELACLPQIRGGRAAEPPAASPSY